MEHKLSNLKHFKQTTLTDEERAYLRGRLAQLVTAPQPARQTFYGQLLSRGMQHGLSIALSSFLLVIFVGGSMSAVAAHALPGDPLYAFKINVNEEVKAAFLKTPEEKVAYAQDRVSNRVQEIKTLAQTKSLTQAKQATAQKALDENIQDLSSQLSTLSDESPSTALTVTANLQQNLQQDKQEIQSSLSASTDTTDDPTAQATIQTIDGTIQKVSQQEVKILSKEIDDISTEVDATSTDTSDINTTDTSSKTDTDDSTDGTDTDSSTDGQVKSATTGPDDDTTTDDNGSSSTTASPTPVSP